MPFDEIAPIVGRSPAAARNWPAGRAAGCGARHCPTPTWPAQREVVDAFLAAAHAGDFEALLAVLDPDVVLRADGGAARPEASLVLRGAANVAAQTLMTAQPATLKRPALVNGVPVLS